MFRFQCAYRHEDGGLRGYIGYGFASYSARDDAITQIRKECEQRKETLVLTGPNCRFHENKKRLTDAELKSVQRQWKQIRDAKKKAGASIY